LNILRKIRIGQVFILPRRKESREKSGEKNGEKDREAGREEGRGKDAVLKGRITRWRRRILISK